MIGAVIGDVVGSAYEHCDIKGYTLPLTLPTSTITDDTVLIGAIADALGSGRPFDDRLRYWGNRYLNLGFGPGFENWLADDGLGPYMSSGNGAAVRAIAIGFLGNPGTIEKDVLEATDCTHNTEEAHRGAFAIAKSLRLLLEGNDPSQVFSKALRSYGLKAPMDLDELHRAYEFDATCDATVPVALSIAVQARDFKDAMCKGLYVGGDTDSILAMVGALRQAMNPDDIPGDLRSFALRSLRLVAPDIEPLLGL